MHDNPNNYTDNEILLGLPSELMASLYPLLERVDLPLGKQIYRPDEVISHVYFPDRAMISVVAYTENGQGTEVAVIGYEGITGLDVVLGSDRASNEHITQIPHGALKMKTADVRRQFALGGPFQDALLTFVRKFIVQISQTALCNRLHNTEQRFSRWLLMCHDRAQSSELHITQEFLAIMLGSNRSTVTMTAIELQNNGLISYSRGKLTIINRPKLEEYSCACYQTIRQAYAPAS